MRSLKFQIVLALLLMASLFAVAVLYALHTIDQQRFDDHMLRMGSELRLLQQQLSMQAMNYKENAPRDYTSYFRDTRLYYRQLINDRQRIGDVIMAFATASAPTTAKARRDRKSLFKLSAHSRKLATDLKIAWDEFDQRLDERLGDPKAPRLEWGAEWILSQHPVLDKATQAFLNSLEDEIKRRDKQAHDLGKVLLTAGLLTALLIVFWFYRQVLRPLNRAVEGFRQVAAGDFSYRVNSNWNNEIGWLINIFNLLTGRLDALLQLLTRLQESKTLDDSLQVLSTTLPSLVPIDWVGMLLLSPDGRMRLERAYSDNAADNLEEQAFRLEGTLLEECLTNGSPLHIPAVEDTARLDSRYRFLMLLARRGRHDAVFMPILGNEPKVGVLVLASRQPNSYRTEQVRLLHNLSALFSATFGRSVALLESARLANIGQFASGIVHEIRTPLGTIGMALEHLVNIDELPKGARRRATLAYSESQRLRRLLDDILLYAKPLELKTQSVALADIVQEIVELGFRNYPLLNIDYAAIGTLPPIPLDKDRMQQVLLNLLRNAIEANGDDPRGIQLSGHMQDANILLELSNGGPPIPHARMEQLYEPFYTSKPSGTGLGLAIVRRIMEAHGGSISIASDKVNGTRVSLLLPARESPSGDAQAAFSD